MDRWGQEYVVVPIENPIKTKIPVRNVKLNGNTVRLFHFLHKLLKLCIKLVDLFSFALFVLNLFRIAPVNESMISKSNEEKESIPTRRGAGT